MTRQGPAPKLGGYKRKHVFRRLGPAFDTHCIGRLMHTFRCDFCGGICESEAERETLSGSGCPVRFLGRTTGRDQQAEQQRGAARDLAQRAAADAAAPL